MPPVMEASCAQPIGSGHDMFMAANTAPEIATTQAIAIRMSVMLKAVQALADVLMPSLSANACCAPETLTLYQCIHRSMNSNPPVMAAIRWPGETLLTSTSRTPLGLVDSHAN